MYFLLEKMSPWLAWVLVLSSWFIRYLLFAGGFFLVFYVLKRQAWFHRKIQLRFPKKKRIYGEIFYSVCTLSIVTTLGLSLYFARKQGYTQIYTEIETYGWLYFWLSIPLILFIHDTYFYWTHRFMHLPKIYPWVHRVHHYSHNPSPWASFAFHPLETLIEYGIIFIVFIIPFHPLALLFFATYSVTLNVIGHLGYEIFPRKFTKHWLVGWHNTSTHHNMHHQLVNCNYSFYFNFWDHLMGTNHPDYHKRFDEVKARSRP